MKTFYLHITLQSPCLVGSGEGFGTVIDSDIVFDELGIPFIPAKRIKGCLRDSAIEVCEIFESAKINLVDLQKDGSENIFEIVSSIFGKQGEEKSAPVYFSNLTILGYKEIKDWLTYLTERHGRILSRESIISQYTEIRQQTAIDEEKGTAKEHSLRTIRVAKKGLNFEGMIEMENFKEEWLKLLSFACMNFRHMGTKRNRGFGLIECGLFENSEQVNFIKSLEEICMR